MFLRELEDFTLYALGEVPNCVLILVVYTLSFNSFGVLLVFGRSTGLLFVKNISFIDNSIASFYLYCTWRSWSLSAIVYAIIASKRSFSLSSSTTFWDSYISLLVIN